MNTTQSRNRTALAALIALAVVGGVTYSVSAWTAPGSTPPKGNVTGPVTTGGTAQTKSGILGVAQLYTSGYGALPGGWSGIHTWDVWARASVRANMYCFGTQGGTDQRDCIYSWSDVGGGTTPDLQQVTDQGNQTTKDITVANSSTDIKVKLGTLTMAGSNSFGLQIDRSSSYPRVGVGLGGDFGTAAGMQIDHPGDSTVWSAFANGGPNDGWDTVITARGANNDIRFDVNAGGRMWILTNGNVGIGQSNPSEKLQVNGTVRASTFKSSSSCYSDGSGTCSVTTTRVDNNSVRITSLNDYPQITLGTGQTLAQGLTANGVPQANGIRANNFWSNGTIRTGVLCLGGAQSSASNTLGDCKAAWPASDARLKKDVSGIESPLERILKLRGVQYEWKDASRGADKMVKQEVGLIAQEVLEVFPEVVHKFLGKDGMYWIEYGQLIGPMVEAVKEQQTQIESLEDRIKLLEEKLAK